jgi:hypothetical protein
VLQPANLTVLPRVVQQPVGLRRADFEFSIPPIETRAWNLPANTLVVLPAFAASGRSETADFEFSGLRYQDSNLEPTG